MATKQQAPTLENLRAGLVELSRERDELRGKLIRLERQSGAIDLGAGAASAVATLSPILAEKDATARVLGALEGQLADLGRRIRAAEEEEAERVRQAALAEAETALADVVKAALALRPLLDKLGDATRRGGGTWHGASLLAIGLDNQLRAWEGDDVGRRLLGLPPLPTSADRELVEAASAVKRLEARLAQLQAIPGNDAERMGADAQAALGTARERLAVAKGARKPRPRVVEMFSEYGRGIVEPGMGPLTLRPRG